ncbi:MAG: hypothetical protein HOJ21_04695 [Alphaproteobacteria bacterium]|nr:hypothetical protein [Alphaproteobacteria bacterium]
MYRLKPGIKQDPERRWALPDRVFFGFGACHILAGVYLQNPPLPGFLPERIIPGDGFSGNHIYVTNGDIAFDYRGHVKRERLLRRHTTGWAEQYPGGWNCRLEQSDFDLLDTHALNQRKMRGPDQYFGDPVACAKAFIAKIDHRRNAAKAASAS